MAPQPTAGHPRVGREEVKRSFTAFSRARSASDRLPASAAARPRWEAGESRRAATSSSGVVYVVPGDQETCVVVADPSGEWSDACAPNAIAASEGVFLSVQCGDDRRPNARTIFGVAPRSAGRPAVRSGGREVASGVSAEGGFVFQVDEPIDEITIGQAKRTLPPTDC